MHSYYMCLQLKQLVLAIYILANQPLVVRAGVILQGRIFVNKSLDW